MNLVELLYPRAALFLDFDGTLVNIAPQPDAVVVPPALVETLGGLNDRLGGALALVSGRPIDQIDAFVTPLRLAVAGVHGAELRDAGGTLTQQSPPPLDRVGAAARQLAGQHPGLLVEIKRGSVALHYRQAPHLESVCIEAMQQAVDQTPGLALMQGKMIAEAKPANVSKGAAVEALMRSEPFAGRTPIFIGDDVTDEAGFAAAQRLGGIGVKVGEGDSVAQQRIASPAALLEQLRAAVAAL